VSVRESWRRVGFHFPGNAGARREACFVMPVFRFDEQSEAQIITLGFIIN